MCAPHPIDPANLLAPIETAVPPEYDTQSRGDAEAPKSPALAAMGYRVLEDGPLVFNMALETPFEGASIRARLSTYEDRQHYGCVAVHNARGLGWDIGVFYHDMGRSVARELFRSLAIEMRRAYCHRGQNIRRRAIARAIARRGAEEAARA